MSYTRYFVSVFDLCCRRAKNEAALELQAEQRCIVFTPQQLRDCLNTFKGNWEKDIENNLTLIHKQLNEYVTRYLKNTGIKWIAGAASGSSPPMIESNYVHISNYDPLFLVDVDNWNPPGFGISNFKNAHWLTAIHANCIVYFANTAEELITLHEKTVQVFNESIQIASKIDSQHATLPFPPVFLVITDPHSKLLNRETLLMLPVPILHSMSVSVSITQFKDNQVYIDSSFWQSLIKNTIAPSFELLAKASRLIDKVALPLTNHTQLITQPGVLETFLPYATDNLDSDWDSSSESDLFEPHTSAIPLL